MAWMLAAIQLFFSAHELKRAPLVLHVQLGDDAAKLEVDINACRLGARAPSPPRLMPPSRPQIHPSNKALVVSCTSQGSEGEWDTQLSKITRPHTPLRR